MNNITLSPLQAVRQVLAGLVSSQVHEFNYLLCMDACLQICSGGVPMHYTSPANVCEALREQTSLWPTPLFFDVQNWQSTPTAATVQFEIWDRPNGRILDPLCSLSLSLRENKIATLQLSQNRLLKASQSSRFSA